MSFFDRLFGRDKDDERQPQQRQLSEDEQAIERYRYMLRTAPPDQIEQAHAEAFERLSPEQREVVLRELSANLPAGERATADDPRALARMATRAEVRQPGTLERVWGGMRGPGYGGNYGNQQGMVGGFGGSFMSTMAGAFVGTAIANSLFGGWGAGFGGMDMGAGGAFGTDQAGDQGADPGADVQAEGDSGGGFGSWDGGGDAGADFGGDFGGGDF